MRNINGYSVTEPNKYSVLSAQNVSVIYKALFQGLEKTSHELKEFLTLILNDPDLYTPGIFTFFD